ncbi:MAG: T9SS type A sorting domain-containing protein [Flavobacteriales bacterium]
MKRILLALTAVFSVATASAQLPSGTLAPDFTAVDRDGNTHHLYDYLQQGYTVVIDVSAAWCGPCWAYHNSGALETLHADHGVDNGGNVIVLFIEGEAGNTDAQITGTSGSGALYSQGDWTAGTEYPIIDDASVANTLEIAYFPTIYTVCPTGIITETGQITAAQHWAFIENNTCQTVASDDASALMYTGDNVTCGDAALSFDMANLGTNTLTAATINVTGVSPEINYNWTGSLEQFESENVDLGTATVTGDVVITVTAAGDGVASNNALNADISLATEATTHFVVHIRFDNWPEEVSWDFRNENNQVVTASPSYAAATDGSTVTQHVFLPSTGCYSFNLYDGYGDGMNGSIWNGTAGDGYCYVYSVADNGTSNPDILAYDGSYGYEQMTVGANVNTVVGVEETVENNISLNIYPNPANGIANISYGITESATVSIDVFNLVGEKVMTFNKGTMAAGNYIQQVDFSTLSAGMYMVNFTANGVSNTMRVTVAK